MGNSNCPPQNNYSVQAEQDRIININRGIVEGFARAGAECRGFLQEQKKQIDNLESKVKSVEDCYANHPNPQEQLACITGIIKPNPPSINTMIEPLTLPPLAQSTDKIAVAIDPKTQKPVGILKRGEKFSLYLKAAGKWEKFPAGSTVSILKESDMTLIPNGRFPIDSEKQGINIVLPKEAPNKVVVQIMIHNHTVFFLQLTTDAPETAPVRRPVTPMNADPTSEGFVDDNGMWWGPKQQFLQIK